MQDNVGPTIDQVKIEVKAEVWKKKGKQPKGNDSKKAAMGNQSIHQDEKHLIAIPIEMVRLQARERGRQKPIRKEEHWNYINVSSVNIRLSISTFWRDTCWNILAKSLFHAIVALKRLHRNMAWKTTWKFMSKSSCSIVRHVCKDLMGKWKEWARKQMQEYSLWMLCLQKVFWYQQTQFGPSHARSQRRKAFRV